MLADPQDPARPRPSRCRGWRTRGRRARRRCRGSDGSRFAGDPPWARGIIAGRHRETKGRHVPGAERQPRPARPPRRAPPCRSPASAVSSRRPNPSIATRNATGREPAARHRGVPPAERRRRIAGPLDARSRAAAAASSHDRHDEELRAAGSRAADTAGAPSRPDSQAPNAEDHVALGTLRAARRQREAEPLGARARRSSPSARRTRRRPPRAASRSSQEPDAEAEERRELRPAIDHRVDEGAAWARRAPSAAPRHRRGCRACRRGW